MADMCNFYFRQKISEAELDLAFHQLEQADQDLASDIGVYGIISGGEPTPHEPVADLSIDLTGPCRAYDHWGQRIFVPTKQVIDCSLDYTGMTTNVSTEGNERWLGIFLKFDRSLSDPRTDGNSQQVHFRRSESYQIRVKQGAEAPIGSAERVAPLDDELLICDVRRIAGQNQIFEEDIKVNRRQNFIFAEADAVSVISGAWGIVHPEVDTVQGALDSVDQQLDDHFSGTGKRHSAADIDYSAYGFILGNNTKDALKSISDRLQSVDSASSGASIVGSDGEAGTPYSLTTGNVRSQLAELLGYINQHLSKVSWAHNASSIAASSYDFLTDINVQAQLQQLVDTLRSAGTTPGAARIGNKEIDQGIVGIGAGTLEFQLDTLAGMLDTFSQETNTVAQGLDTVSNDMGMLAEELTNHNHDSAYASTTHSHDNRYLRSIGNYELSFAAGENKTFNLAGFPHVVDLKYRILENGYPSDKYVVAGNYTSDIQVIIKKVTAPQGFTYYTADITNTSALAMNICLNVFTVDIEE